MTFMKLKMLSDGSDVWVNPDQIAYFNALPENGTIVYFAASNTMGGLIGISVEQGALDLSERLRTLS